MYFFILKFWPFTTNPILKSKWTNKFEYLQEQFSKNFILWFQKCYSILSKDDLLFIYEASAQTLLKVLRKFHEPTPHTRSNDAEFLTNMVIQFANQFVCQVDLGLKLVTRRIHFIDTICTVIRQGIFFIKELISQNFIKWIHFVGKK